MKILVTGAAGYIGSILVPRLLASGHQVTTLDNFMFSQASLLDCCADRNFTMVRGDVRDQGLVKKLVAGADAILPLACFTGAPLCDKNPFEAKAVIFDAVKYINDIRSPGQIIVFPTTNSGYGIGDKDTMCTEESPLNPISLYGRLKVDAEKVLLDSGNCVTLRLATAFGISPRMRLDLLVNDFTYRALNDRYLVVFEPHFRRNFIHVRDIAKAFIHVLDNFPALKNCPYNVGLSTANISKWQLCEAIRRQLPEFYFIEAALGRDPDKRDYIVSNEKIEKSGFRPDYSLDDGIIELIKGYRIIKANLFSNV